jgi:hypothetical protein
MEKLSLSMFDSSELKVSEITEVKGGRTGPGSKQCGGDSCDSRIISWGSDTDAGVLEGSSYCDDSGNDAP